MKTAVAMVWLATIAFAQPGRPGRGPAGRWWNNPRTIEKLEITADQQKKIDEILQQNRVRLIDANAALDRDEAILDPLVKAEVPDDAKVLAQLDRVAQARAELEKVNSRMLWSLRRVLTADQWKKLQAMGPSPPRQPWP